MAAVGIIPIFFNVNNIYYSMKGINKVEVYPTGLKIHHCDEVIAVTDAPTIRLIKSYLSNWTIE